MNDAALSIACVALLVASSSTGALAASHVAVNSGSSMQPTLCDNSILLVDRDATPEIGDIVALDTGHRITYHRLAAINGSHYIIRGDNNRDDSVDLVDVTGTARTVDVTHLGRDYSYPHREDVVGVVSTVVYDGCGPV